MLALASCWFIAPVFLGSVVSGHVSVGRLGALAYQVSPCVYLSFTVSPVLYSGIWWTIWLWLCIFIFSYFHRVCPQHQFILLQNFIKPVHNLGIWTCLSFIPRICSKRSLYAVSQVDKNCRCRKLCGIMIKYNYILLLSWLFFLICSSSAYIIGLSKFISL